MKHGFLILTHFSPQRVYEQVQRMQHPDHYFFVHFDKKVQLREEDEGYRKLLATDNVTILTDRTDVKWAGFSMLPPIFALMREAVKKNDIGYLHLLSSECLHIKSIPYLHNYFAAHKGTEFIDHFIMPKERQVSAYTYRRIDKYHLYDYYNYKSKKPQDRIIRGVDSLFRKVQRLLKPLGIYRRYPSEFPTLYAGPTWWSLTRGACTHMVRYVDEHPGFYKRFLFTQSADEIIVHTLLLNSPYKGNVVNNNLRYYHFEHMASHPNPLTMQYIDGIMQEDKLFARKFTPASKELLDYLDKNVY